MPTFLLEVPHQNSKSACDLAVNVFKATGSHFLTHADFGCLDGVHKAWIVIDTKTKREALYVVPPPFRAKAKAIRVKKFALEKMEKTFKPRHK